MYTPMNFSIFLRSSVSERDAFGSRTVRVKYEASPFLHAAVEMAPSLPMTVSCPLFFVLRRGSVNRRLIEFSEAAYFMGSTASEDQANLNSMTG